MDLVVDNSGGLIKGTEVKSTTRKRSPSTPRTQRLKQVYMVEKPIICAERNVLVTQSFKDTEALPPVLRQAKAFEKTLNEMPIWIRDDELIVCNLASKPGGSFLFPEYDDSLIIQELDTIPTRRVDPWQIEEDDKEHIRNCGEYWRGRNMTARADALATDEARQAVESGALFNSPMGKMTGVGHIAPHIEGVIKRGNPPWLNGNHHGQHLQQARQGQRCRTAGRPSGRTMFVGA